MFRYILPIIAFVLAAPGPAQAQQPDAYLQIIHASADPSLPAFDLYLDGGLAQANFTLGSATPVMHVSPDTVINIRLHSAGSSPDSAAYLEMDYQPNPDKNWALVLSGVVNEGDFARNPNGWYTFFLYRFLPGVKPNAVSPYYVDLQFFNSVTDAPGVDFVSDAWGTAAADVQFGESEELLHAATEVHEFTVRSTMDPAIEYGTYTIDLAGRYGQAAVVFMTGFLDPEKNQNGPSLNLYAAFSDGTVVPLSAVTSVSETPAAAEPRLEVFPSPAHGTATIAYDLNRAAPVAIDIFDNTGRNVYSRGLGLQPAGSYSTQVEAAAFAPGIYRMALRTGDAVHSRSFVISR